MKAQLGPDIHIRVTTKGPMPGWIAKNMKVGGTLFERMQKMFYKRMRQGVKQVESNLRDIITRQEFKDNPQIKDKRIPPSHLTRQFFPEATVIYQWAVEDTRHMDEAEKSQYIPTGKLLKIDRGIPRRGRSYEIWRTVKGIHESGRTIQATRKEGGGKIDIEDAWGGLDSYGRLRTPGKGRTDVEAFLGFTKKFIKAIMPDTKIRRGPTGRPLHPLRYAAQEGSSGFAGLRNFLGRGKKLPIPTTAKGMAAMAAHGSQEFPHGFMLEPQRTAPDILKDLYAPVTRPAKRGKGRVAIPGQYWLPTGVITRAFTAAFSQAECTNIIRDVLAHAASASTGAAAAIKPKGGEGGGTLRITGKFIFKKGKKIPL